MNYEVQAFWTGVIATVVVVLVGFQVFEGDCQAKNDVADCEWSRSPFTPTIQEPHK
jgi:hypothetical protein